MSGFSNFLLSLIILCISAPLILLALILVFLEDFGYPIYCANRVGRNNKDFKMYKIRTMILIADKIGVNSTSNLDNRITKSGSYIRKLKIDELAQFFNVLIGNMSIVGPRPNTRSWGVDLYSTEEMELLSVKPGITDLSSIVFSDEGSILQGSEHPDQDYNILIRPWKSKLGLFYIRNRSALLDTKIIFCTILVVLSRKLALRYASNLIETYGGSQDLIDVAKREKSIKAYLNDA